MIGTITLKASEKLACHFQDDDGRDRGQKPMRQGAGDHEGQGCSGRGKRDSDNVVHHLFTDDMKKGAYKPLFSFSAYDLAKFGVAQSLTE